ncbi:unnamed protein product [Linum trigynum]|uniref:Peptidase A1 domain-containing protein n=1 Tax=Linum trigynum TaxID=586398 RepID=A0AAV2CT57_9ROSI
MLVVDQTTACKQIPKKKGINLPITGPNFKCKFWANLDPSLPIIYINRSIEDLPQPRPLLTNRAKAGQPKQRRLTFQHHHRHRRHFLRSRYVRSWRGNRGFVHPPLPRQRKLPRRRGFGTPKTKLHLMHDSGSEFSWVDYRQPGKIDNHFDPRSSSTFSRDVRAWSFGLASIGGGSARRKKKRWAEGRRQ